MTHFSFLLPVLFAFLGIKIAPNRLISVRCYSLRFIYDISYRYPVYLLSHLFALNPVLHCPEMRTYRMNNRILLYNIQTVLLRYRVYSFAFLILSWRLPPFRFVKFENSTLFCVGCCFGLCLVTNYSDQYFPKSFYIFLDALLFLFRLLQNIH